MSQPNIAPIITVGTVPRGQGNQLPRTFTAQSMTAAFAWGSSPGTATIVYVGNDALIQTGAFIKIMIGGMLFCGICKSDVKDDSTGGLTRTLQFIDLREYLTWDYIFCAFNKPDVRMVNGVRQKRYWHIYPSDFDTLTKVFTNAPINACDILTYLFNAPTIGTRWAYSQNVLNSLMNWPVYDFDALQGKRFDAALNEICEKMGCVFASSSTVQDPYSLAFVRKGNANDANVFAGLPLVPADSDNRRLGVALSGHPTNVRVLGDRNLYQVMSVPMEADWSPAWEKFIDIDVFVDDIYKRKFINTPNDPEQIQGRLKAAAEASLMTVRDYTELAGSQFSDFRKFAGRYRMDMPAALYIKHIVFRAFRPAADFVFVNAKVSITGGFMANQEVPLTSINIADKLLCKVYQDDPTSGTLQYDKNQPVDGNGFAIVKAYNIAQDLMRGISSSQFTLDFFNNPGNIWTHAPFQIDDSGEGVRFIIFDEPVFLPNNLVVFIDGHGVINANFELGIPQVKAALVFEAERFSYWVGSGGRDTVENVGGLNAEIVIATDGNTYEEVLYSNNQSSQTKAQVIGESVLLRQFYYAEGAHKWIWNPATTPINDFGIALNSMIDRLVIKTSPQEGTTLVVDYTNERIRDRFEPEREMERRTVGNSLFSGQQELRIQAEDYKKLAAAFKQSPKVRRDLQDLLAGRLGSEAPFEMVRFQPGTEEAQMAVGTVIRKKPTDNTGATNTNTVATNPENTSSADNIFVGVTVRNNEWTTWPFNVQRTGHALARVKGPVSANDSLGLSDGTDPANWDYLIKDGSVAVGSAKQAIADSSIKLIEVDLGSAGSSATSGPYRIKDVFDDYMVCRTVKWTWDKDALDWFATEGTDDVYIAKEWKHRCSLTTEKILNIPFDYTYEDGPIETWAIGQSAAFNVTRVSAIPGGGSSERQRLIPPWSENEEIYATTADTGVYRGAAAGGGPEEFEEGEAVTLLISNRSCQWARV